MSLIKKDKVFCSKCAWLRLDRSNRISLRQCNHPKRIKKEKIDFVTGHQKRITESCYNFNSKGECKLFKEGTNNASVR